MPDVINDNGTWVIKEDINITNLKTNVVELTDGSWTFIDPMSQVKSNTFANKINTVTLQDIAAGNANQNTQNDFQGARWYKLLKYDDGTQVNSEDNFIFIASVQAHSSSNPSPFGLAIGTARDPLATGSVGLTRQTFQHVGYTNETVNTNTGRSHEYDRMIKLAGGSAAANHTTASVSELTHKFSAGKNYGIISTPERDNQTFVNGTEYTSNVSIYLQVAVITRFNTNEALEDAQHRHTLKYQVIKVDET